ncbi:MAG: peptidoglycan editing factor PgeF [Syntrophomonadaceae bacterium]|nr:peptidoglycan editing factor PgeF [Syntrophomonadaceae bacterium]
MTAWTWCQRKGISFITLPGWEEQGVKVAVSGRMGGCSTGEFSSLNLALHVGDKTAAVFENRRRWAEALEVELARMVCACQVHSANVRVVDENDRGRGVFDYPSGLPDTDAMVTSRPEIFLVTFYADCIPVLLFDAKKRVIGMAHSGWKGTVARIAERTVRCMMSCFGCEPADILAFIGPGIGRCCYEIGGDLARAARRKFPGQVLVDHDERFYWDLPGTNRFILEQAGLLAPHITTCELCTACNQDLLFSYRGSRGKTGRMAVVLGMVQG